MSGKAADISTVTLGFKPLTVGYTWNGQFLLVGGTCNGVHMYTSEGIHVREIAAKGSWVWSAAACPSQTPDEVQLACGCEDGSVSLETVSIPVTQGLYQARSLCGDSSGKAAFRMYLTARCVFMHCMSCVAAMASPSCASAIHVTAFH